MPKLNATIDQIELNTNKILSTTTASPDTWTDTQYPSAKTLLNIAHPVGSMLITSTNTTPEATLGGTWEFVDKGFKSVADSTAATNIFIPAANVVVEDVHYCRAGHSVRVRLLLKINAPLSGTGMSLGNLVFDNIGISEMTGTIVGQLSHQDGANSGIVYSVWHNTGCIEQIDIFDATAIDAGAEFPIDVTIMVDHTRMLDTACDKFYWKRIA